MARGIEELHRDQEIILAAYRAERSPNSNGDVRVAASADGGTYGFGRVDDIVESDADHGPHVLVIRQAWKGSPPVPCDSGAGPVRCQLVPGRSVEDFAVNNLVRMIYVSGAILAEPLE